MCIRLVGRLFSVHSKPVARFAKTGGTACPDNPEGSIMPIRLSVWTVFLSLLATNAFADMVVINDRYVVAKDTVRGYFYRDRDRKTVFDIRWSDWSTQYRCDDTYDRTRVQAAMLNFALQMDKTNAMDFQMFLEDQGFSGCA